LINVSLLNLAAKEGHQRGDVRVQLEIGLLGMIGDLAVAVRMQEIGIGRGPKGGHDILPSQEALQAPLAMP
jgi:hypothetical protein